MARMHSRDKGKASSTKPSKVMKPTWIRYKPKEVELLTVKLAKEGNTMSQIGMILRDIYGIPSISAVTGKSVNAILEANKIKREIPEDLRALIKKAVMISKHNEGNRQDMTAKRGLQLTESKIKRLANYYKKKGKLPADWKYDKKSMQLYV